VTYIVSRTARERKNARVDDMFQRGPRTRFPGGIHAITIPIRRLKAPGTR
jgi:hypothetical protein